MSRPILVTGATGNLGGAAARSMLAAGLQVRVAGTDLQRLRALFPGVEAVCLDLRRPWTFSAAVRDIGGIFLMRPPAVARVGPTLNTLIDAVQENQNCHAVFVSVAGADTNRFVPHHRVEEHLHASSLEWTILRPGFFAQNLADAYRDDIRDDDRIYLPAGRGRVAFVDTRDVGEVAAAVFTDPVQHRGTAYTLTGPQALDFATVAALLTDALGRTIAYEPAGIIGYLQHLRRRRLPPAQCVVQAVLHVGLRRGRAGHVDATLSDLLGRPARTMRHYVDDHRELWLPQ